MNKIIELPFRVAEGLNKSADIAGYFGFAQRQSSYYREAAEALKLVKLDEGNIYTLTPTGRKFTTLPIEKRNQLLCRQMMDLPIIKEILSNLYEKKTLTFTEVARIIGYNTNLTGETPARRASCLKNWFYWLYSATGMIKVSKTRLFL
ncbi:MAG: AAA-associated domain-containing protein [Firmicutes bacterium]|nr:AAA-associated domain-containing protein [Bacillota bacterium]